MKKLPAVLLFGLVQPALADSWAVLQSATFNTDLYMEQTDSDNAVQAINNVDLSANDTLDQTGKGSTSTQTVDMSGHLLELGKDYATRSTNSVQAVNRIHAGTVIGAKQEIQNVEDLHMKLYGANNTQAANLITADEVVDATQTVTVNDDVRLYANSPNYKQAVNMIVADDVDGADQSVTAGGDMSLGQYGYFAYRDHNQNLLDTNKQSLNMIDAGNLSGDINQSLDFQGTQYLQTSPSGGTNQFYNSVYFDNAAVAARVNQSVNASTVNTMTNQQGAINAFNAVIKK